MGRQPDQVLGEGVDVAEGLEAGEVRPDPGDDHANLTIRKVTKKA